MTPAAFDWLLTGLAIGTLATSTFSIGFRGKDTDFC